MNKVKVEKFLTWRLGRKEELKPGQGYKCAPSMSAMNTPLPESPTGCDHLVSRLSCVPCCNCDTLSLSDADSSPELGKPFGRISQFRPHDIDSQWDRCIGSVGSACSNGREVGPLQSCNEDSSKILGEGLWYWIHDFVASFGLNNRPIYMALCS